MNASFMIMLLPGKLYFCLGVCTFAIYI